MAGHSFDYYEILGIARSASADDVHRAYRRLAHQTHPDKNGTGGLFRFVSLAHEVLSDPQRRLAYDAELDGRVPHPAEEPAGPPRPRQEEPTGAWAAGGWTTPPRQDAGWSSYDLHRLRAESDDRYRQAIEEARTREVAAEQAAREAAATADEVRRVAQREENELRRLRTAAVDRVNRRHWIRWAVGIVGLAGVPGSAWLGVSLLFWGALSLLALAAILAAVESRTALSAMEDGASPPERPPGLPPAVRGQRSLFQDHRSFEEALSDYRRNLAKYQADLARHAVTDYAWKEMWAQYDEIVRNWRGLFLD